MNDTVKKFEGKDLENMTVDQILNLGLDQVQKFERIPYPAGLYRINILPFTLPGETKENPDAFIANLTLEEIIEFHNPEESQTFNLKPGSKMTQRYKIGVGIQALVTEWEPTLQACNGHIGQMMAALKQHGVLAGTCVIGQRKDKEKKDDDGKPLVYNSLSKVTPVQ